MQANRELRILIADDHGLVLEGISALLEEKESIYVVGTAKDGQELVEKYFKLMPHIVLADISMPKMTGIEALRKIKAKDKHAKVIFLSMLEGNDYIYSIYKAGGMGLINKDIAKGELYLAIDKVAKGGTYFGNNLSKEEVLQIVSKFEDDPNFISESIIQNELSDREKEVLLYIAEGLTSEEIGEKLFISKRTVDSHRLKIMEQLNIDTRPQLIKIAVKYSKIV